MRIHVFNFNFGFENLKLYRNASLYFNNLLEIKLKSTLVQNPLFSLNATFL